MCGVFALLMLGMLGCVRQSEYDAKATELKKQAKRLSEAEEKASQLQKDLDAAKSQAEKAEQAKNDAEAKIKTLEQENTDLKKPVAEPETPQS